MSGSSNSVSCEVPDPSLSLLQEAYLEAGLVGLLLVVDLVCALARGRSFLKLSTGLALRRGRLVTLRRHIDELVLGIRLIECL